MAAPKDTSTIAPPSSPMMTATVPVASSKPEPDDIPEPTVPAAVLEAATAPALSTLPDGFGAHEALLQGFCQHLQQRLHSFMLDEHKGLMQTLDATLVAMRKWVETVGHHNEHAQYSMADALSKLQADGLTVIHPPYQAILAAQTPAGYALTLTLTKSTSGALVEELGRLEGWLQANGYKATEEVRL